MNYIMKMCKENKKSEGNELIFRSEYFKKVSTKILTEVKQAFNINFKKLFKMN